MDEKNVNCYTSEIDELLLKDSEVVRVKTVRKSYESCQYILFGLWILYTIISLPVLAKLAKSHIPQPYSPMNKAITYGRQPLYFGEDSEYAGAPDSVDGAWKHLLEPVNIRVTKKELHKSRNEVSDEIVQLPDGDYVSVLSVYHELHCLNALRMNIHHDHYYPNATVEEEEYNIVHMTHCVDTIRRSLMCKADIALYSAYWIGAQTALPSKELRSKSDTVCVDWKQIDSWARERLLEKGVYKVRPGPFE